MASPSHANLMRDLLQAMQELTRQSQALPPQNVQQPPNLPPNASGAIPVVEQFRKYRPPTFDGGSDSLAVEQSIRSLERIFRHIECTETQKVQCKDFMLVGPANHWWEQFHELGLRSNNVI
ncbi:Uncharacterized protein Adt_00611 [Abeliophyllum distichum]|uniref:Uncharacterized protein n=1 Tax=Abeliophyllum distichum TaxID=126358 RepID=A0ABD1VSC9_9LAMI